MTALQREALQMCLEYIETDVHERRHVRWKIQEALAAPDLQAELDATNKQVEILSDALAESRAAVPDLLEALQAIVKSLSDQDDEGMIEHAQPMIDARAAIAKATGQ